MSVNDPIIRRALISVADKSGILELARTLHNRGVDLLATGNTALLLRQQDLPVTEVSEYTQFPEMMGGRVKTLHPKIHGGILARRDQDMKALEEHNIPPIDLVIINLYPFAQTIQKPGCTFDQAIEQIDVGGPTMLRGAAKNHAFVTVVTEPKDYDKLVEALEKNDGRVPFALRQQLAQKTFAHTAEYDALVAEYLSRHISATTNETLPENVSLSLKKSEALRYGENPQQAAAFYNIAGDNAGIPWEFLQGKALSFNNLVDADVAWGCVNALSPQKACVIVKHANPCGVAVAEDLTKAYQRAYQSDSTSAFGGIIAFNDTLDEDTCRTILQQQFVEVIIAPSFSKAALTALASKPNVRALSVKETASSLFPYDLKCLSSGFLIQERDTAVFTRENSQVVTKRSPSEAEWKDLLFAWDVCRWVKSNAIVYAKELQTMGIGAGQTSRVSSAALGILKSQEANLSVKNAVVASDAFYPFRDGVDKAAEAGVTAIIQPGGSLRDAEVIAAADEHGLAMVFTGIRHFRH